MGEVLAKVLAIGGAEVLLTYHVAEENASRLVTDILEHGGEAACIKFDVTDEGSESMSLQTEWQPPHLYYMATPFISSGQHGVFCNKIFVRFCDYCAIGFSG